LGFTPQLHEKTLVNVADSESSQCVDLLNNLYFPALFSLPYFRSKGQFWRGQYRTQYRLSNIKQNILHKRNETPLCHVEALAFSSLRGVIISGVNNCSRLSPRAGFYISV